MEQISLSIVVAGLAASIVAASPLPMSAAASNPVVSPVSIGGTSTTTLTPKKTAKADHTADGCVASVDKLPASGLYSRHDRRLRAATLVVVLKGKRRLMLFSKGKAKKTAAGRSCWHIGLGSDGPTGAKLREGDMKTPEGWYRTSDKPWSRFYHAIAIHYPNAADAKRGLRARRITRRTYRRILHALHRGRKPPQHTALGGEVLIHGGGGSSDWTLGCVALDNTHLDDLRAALPAGKRFDVLLLP